VVSTHTDIFCRLPYAEVDNFPIPSLMNELWNWGVHSRARRIWKTSGRYD